MRRRATKYMLSRRSDEAAANLARRRTLVSQNRIRLSWFWLSKHRRYCAGRRTGFRRPEHPKNYGRAELPVLSACKLTQPRHLSRVVAGLVPANLDSARSVTSNPWGGWARCRSSAPISPAYKPMNLLTEKGVFRFAWVGRRMYECRLHGTNLFSFQIVTS